MTSLPRKFYRILIDGFWVLLCFCGGRKRTANPSNTQLSMEPISILIRKLDCAVSSREYWKEERRKLGTLTAPVTDWKLLRYSNEVVILSRKIAERIDEVIPTHQLYVDLLESAE